MRNLRDDLQRALNESRAWLDAQLAAEERSHRWYALGNFRTFLESIEDDPTPSGIERASHILSRHITDQFDWSANYCRTISDFNQRFSLIAKDMAWHESRDAR